LKTFTSIIIGHSLPSLADCLREMERSRRITHYRKGLFHQLLRLRNKAIHQPTVISERDFDAAARNLKLLEDALQG